MEQLPYDFFAFYSLVQEFFKLFKYWVYQKPKYMPVFFWLFLYKLITNTYSREIKEFSVHVDKVSHSKGHYMWYGMIKFSNRSKSFMKEFTLDERDREKLKRHAIRTLQRREERERERWYSYLDVRPDSPLEVIESAFQARLQTIHIDTSNQDDHAKWLTEIMEEVRHERKYLSKPSSME